MSGHALAKRLVFGAALLVVSPLAVASWIEKHLLRTEWLFNGCAQLLALGPGLPGAWLRSAFYWASLDDCSWEVHIGFGTLFTHRHARLGARVSTGSYCVLGHVHLGAGCRLASRVSVPSGRRQHLDDTGAMGSHTQFDTVVVGEECWIGEGAIVMADVGRGTLVGAGAVVTRPMPAGVLLSGNPAAVIRELPTSAGSSS